jgi:hypothetical protein
MPIFDQLPFAPKIRIGFNGFVIARIRDGADAASVAAHRESPCHQPAVRIREITPDGQLLPALEDKLPKPPNLTGDFSLSVENPFMPKIQTYQKDPYPFNRLDDENDSKDFRWVIDFEDFFGKQVSLDLTKLGPTFTLDNGIFYTNTPSKGEVKIKRGNTDARRFGRYGLEIGANIYFDPNGNDASRKAVFKYAGTEVFSVTEAQKTRYEIDFDCDCRIDLQESDFPLIFDVVKGLTADDQKITLVGDTVRAGGAHTPEVYCGGGNCSNC